MLTVTLAITDTSFVVLFFFFFYLSIKKCFWKGDIKKSKLIIRCILNNPMIIYVFSLFLGGIVISPIYAAGVGNTAAIVSGETTILNMLSFCLGGFLYPILLLLFSGRMAKWLKADSKSLVRFVFLMYGVLVSLTLNGSLIDVSSEIISGEAINFLVDLVFIIAVFLIYFFIVTALSRMKADEKDINWKLFVIPPTAFILCYTTIFTLLIGMKILTNQSVLVVFFFSAVMSFVFIWAFYVIIKNISATTEAVKAKNEVKELSVEVMEALAHTIDAKDEYTKGHSIRVAKYSRMIAGKMGFSEKECEDIYYMGLLHDLGKIGVPNEIINSPGPLNDEQYSVIKTHPVLGYDILSEIKSRPDLVMGARWHHERYDGKGYPDGKSGEDIPVMARIIAVADSYDAMTSNRRYRKYTPQDKVRSELEKNRGTQFDPDIASYMIAIMDEDTEYELHE